MYYIVGIMGFGMTKGSEGGAISERGLLRVGDVVRSSLELGDPNSGFSLAPNAYLDFIGKIISFIVDLNIYFVQENPNIFFPSFIRT